MQGGLVCCAGPPQLMMAFTAPGQLDPALLMARDEKYGIDSLKVAEHRRQVSAFKESTFGWVWQHSAELLSFSASDNIEKRCQLQHGQQPSLSSSRS